MADTKLSALTEATTLSDDDEFYVNDSGTSKRITKANLDDAIVTPANVAAAGALMDSEVTNLAQVKAFDSSDYATAAQGATADTATQPGDDADTLGSGTATDGQVLTADGAGNAAWEDAATGTPEGTAILSTGEVGGTKFLREDGDGTSSWQAIPAPEGTSVLSTGPVTDGYVLTADGAGGAAWEAAAGGGGAFTADVNTQITPSTAIVLDQATGDEVALDLSATINKATSGNYTLLYADVTETSAPGTADYLIDLKVGGSQKFSVLNDGSLKNLGGFRFINNGVSSFPKVYISQGVDLTSDSNLRWRDSISSSTGTPDVYLYRDASGVLALRNSTNAQTFNVYNTYTDASNYERGFMRFNANILEIGTEAAGTGTGRGLALESASGDITLGTGSTVNFLATQKVYFRHSNDVTSGSFFALEPTSTANELTDTNGQQAMLLVRARVAQSSTAAFDAIFVDTLEEAFGDGSTGDGNNLLRLSSLGTTQFKVSTDGVMTVDSAGHTVAGLPSGSVGMIARVTDADTPAVGSTVTGGGAAAALCWYNGSSWTVLGV